MLSGITAVAANDIWTVGFSYYDSQADRAVLIGHWNGTAWSIVPGATTGDTDSTLNSVAAVSSTDVWAVGYGISATTSGQPLVEQWDGKAWNVVADSVSGSTAQLLGVAASNTGAVWAVGDTRASSGESIPLAEQWTGSAWTIVPSAQVGGIGSGLQGVGITSSGILAVGFSFMSNSPAGDTHTLIERWNGTEFYPVADAPGSTQQGILYSVAAPATGAVWAVGGLGTSINPTQTLAEDFVAPLRGILCP